MIRVLLLGAGGNVSQGILKAIIKSKLDCYVIGACISEYSSGLYFCDEALISPYASDEIFIEWVINVCNGKNIDVILTGVEENIIVLAKNYELLKNSTKAVFISSTYEQLLIGQNKLRTCQWLKENDCNYPLFARLDNVSEVDQLLNETTFPLLAKPISGKSGKGIRLIHNEQDLNGITNKDAYVLEEYIGSADSEYTVGCYCNKDGFLSDMIIMQRRLRNGTTIYAKVIENEVIRAEAEKICRMYRPVGPLNIQMRTDKNGRPVCFELNVRFSGSTAMRTNFGYHDVEALIKEYVLNESIEDCFDIRYGESFRFDSEMYIFDDSVNITKRNGFIDDIAGRFIVVDDSFHKRRK